MVRLCLFAYALAWFRYFSVLGACPSNAFLLTGQATRDVVSLLHGKNIQIMGR